ncbi:MAG: thermonuclease family protein [Turicibacter sp.]|nr:thermonuclease family protein [Turicibacter sp.]
MRKWRKMAVGGLLLAMMLGLAACLDGGNPQEVAVAANLAEVAVAEPTPEPTPEPTESEEDSDTSTAKETDTEEIPPESEEDGDNTTTEETAAAEEIPLPVGLEQAVVERVIDGDTIVLTNGERVRFIGIDAPEIGEPGADLATEFVRNQIDGQTVWLSSSGNDRDSFGRLRRYVWVEMPTDMDDSAQIQAKQLNAMLLAEGLAVVWTPSGGQPTPLLNPTPQPTATAEPQNIGIISAPNQGRRGQDLTITFQGEPNTEYNLSVVSAAGNTLTADGLGTTTANASGVATWTWRVGSRTGAGNQRAVITGGGVRVEHTIQIVVN